MVVREAASGAAGRRRGRPAASSGAETRRRILTAAQRGFGQMGYRGLAVEQVAREVGIDARGIYHYFPSKRALYGAACEAAFEDYLSDVESLVFVHDDLRGRLHGFVNLYRTLFRGKRHLLSFISVVMVESIVPDGSVSTGEPSNPGGALVEDLTVIGAPILAMNRLLVDQAIARHELRPSVDGEGAMTLLHVVGMGLGLASLGPDMSFLPMLDALDHLIDGTLLGP